MLAYTFNPSTQRQLHEDLCEFSPAWSTDLQDSPEYRKTPSQGRSRGELICKWFSSRDISRIITFGWEGMQWSLIMYDLKNSLRELLKSGFLPLTLNLNVYLMYTQAHMDFEDLAQWNRNWSNKELILKVPPPFPVSLGNEEMSGTSFHGSTSSFKGTVSITVSIICVDSAFPFPLLLLCAVMFSHLAYFIGKHWSLFSSKKCKGV